MPESTLNLTFSELEAEAGYFLGYGRGTNYSDTAWSTRQQKDVTDCVNAGLRGFYYCGYDWSFMRPIRQLLLEANANFTLLPDDFGGIEGQVRLVGSGRAGIPISITNEPAIAQKYFESPDRTGATEYCAVRWAPAAGQKAGRANLYVFPAADQAYTLEVQYYFMADKLSTSFPYAHGGSVHAETIKASVLERAEVLKNNEQGPMAANFAAWMQRSQELDRRNKPQTLGYNGDPSYNQSQWPVGWRHWEQGVPVTWDT